MRKIFALVLCFCMLGVTAHAASMQFAIGDTQVKTMDAQRVITEKTVEIAPFTVDGRTMVPVRVIAENFGAQVGWDDATQTATISTDAVDIALTIGSNLATVNGESVTLDVAAMEQNGRTLVPLRFVSEVLGYNVKYVSSTQQIYITDSPVVFRSPYSLITFEDLKMVYDEYEIKIPSAASGADEKNVRSAHFDALNAIYSDFMVRTAVYDHMVYIEPNSTVTSVMMSLNSPENKAYAVEYAGSLGLLDATLMSYAELGIAEIVYPEVFVSQISEADVEAYYNGQYISAKHILIPTVDLQSGAALPTEEVAAAEAFANDLCTQIANGADFDALMQTYSKDGGLIANPDGYVFTEGEMVEEFYNGAKALEIGQVSAPVLSPFGYHIIKREPLPPISTEQKQAYVNEALYNDVIRMVNNHRFELVMDLDLLLDMLTAQ